MSQTTRQNIGSNSPYEAVVGFSRAVRVRDQVFVAGTVGWRDDKTLPQNAYDQMQQAIANIEAALKRAGAALTDVVRTRIYVTDMAVSDAVFTAHKEAFGKILPVSTLVGVAFLAAPEMLVEIEAEAVVES